jgi:Glycosyl transferases group 1
MSEDYRQALVVYRQVSAGWAKAMMTEIHAGLQAIGVDARLFDPADPDALSTIHGLARRPFYLVDCNHRPSFNAPLRRLSVMVDHPCQRMEDLAEAKPGLEVLGWVDASHPAAADALGVPLRSFFLPHAGPEAVFDPAPMAARTVDIFFPGTLREPPTLESWQTSHSEAHPLIGAIIFETVDVIRQTLTPVVPAFLAACKRNGVDLNGSFTRDLFCTLIGKIIEIAEMARRIDVLSALPRCRIVVASDAMPESLRRLDHIEWLGPIDDFHEIRRLMSQSKIVLNTTSKFPAGSHERIWFAMAEGAVVLTDPSEFIAGDFSDGRDILFLPARDLNALAAVRSYLDAPDRLQALADEARAIYAARHTWQTRAQLLHRAMQF